MNMVSDAKGRKLAILTSLSVILLGIISKLFIVVGSFLGGWFHVIVLVICGQFLCGFGAYAMVTLGYTLLADFCSDELRSRAVIIINSAWYISFKSGDYQLSC